MRYPFFSDTISLFPPTSVAIAGMPQLIASMMATGVPSDALVFTNTSTG